MDVIARKSAPAAGAMHGHTQPPAPGRPKPAPPAVSPSSVPPPNSPPGAAPAPKPHAETAGATPSAAPAPPASPAAPPAPASAPQEQGPAHPALQAPPAATPSAHPALEVRPMPASAEPMHSPAGTDGKLPNSVPSNPSNSATTDESAPKPTTQKPKDQRQLPTGAIVATLLVMAVLMAVAIMAYKHPH